MDIDCVAKKLRFAGVQDKKQRSRAQVSISVFVCIPKLTMILKLYSIQAHLQDAVIFNYGSLRPVTTFASTSCRTTVAKCASLGLGVEENPEVSITLPII